MQVLYALLAFLGGVAAVGVKGWVDLALERRRERLAARAAARLLRDEFSVVELWGHAMAHEEEWFELGAEHDYGDRGFDHDTWREQRAVLAPALDDEMWGMISAGYYALRNLESDARRAVQAADAGTRQLAMLDYEVENVRSFVHDLEDATGALGRIAFPSMRES